MPASYKPSPLSFGSPRTSPFRRPESPASPSPLRNSTTPTTSPQKTMGTPSKLKPAGNSNDSEHWTPRGLPPAPREAAPSPTRGANSNSRRETMQAARPNGDTNAMSKLQPGQVQELREGFQILDRDSDGVVGREDVADMLTQLGMFSSVPTDRLIPIKPDISLGFKHSLTKPRPSIFGCRYIPFLSTIASPNDYTPCIPNLNFNTPLVPITPK